MRRWALMLVATLAACYQPARDLPCTITCNYAEQQEQAACPSGLTCASAGFCTDGTTKCGSDGGVLTICYGTAPNSVCFAEAPTSGISLISELVTDDCVDIRDIGGPTCVIAGTTVDVPVHVLVKGRESNSPKLMLVGSQAIVISGELDVSSSVTLGHPGPGVDEAPCDSATNATGNGGGAGGSIQGMGGLGGGPEPGIPSAPRPAAFRAGCTGGGGEGLTDGGFGGGAVYLISPSITISGFINASGAGGQSGLFGGGGGGGAGGFIGLDSDNTITISAGADRLLAAGGGGGGGSDGAAAGPGGDPSSAAPVGLGGAGGGTAGKGGDGSRVLDGLFGSQPGGTLPGGGGGGGAGYIQFFGATPTQCASPLCTPKATR
jgi:hypothetical protein